MHIFPVLERHSHDISKTAGTMSFLEYKRNLPKFVKTRFGNYDKHTKKIVVYGVRMGCET
jgi:hypothetical protein